MTPKPRRRSVLLLSILPPSPRSGPQMNLGRIALARTLCAGRWRTTMRVKVTQQATGCLPDGLSLSGGVCGVCHHQLV